MKHLTILPVRILAAVALALPLSCLGFKVELKPAATSVSCYDFVELTLQVSEPQAKNPFTDVAIEGSFEKQGETPAKVEGFCDSADGTLFRIRFMPSKPGAYKYSVSYSESGEFKQQFTGSFVAKDDRKKGVVRVDPEFPAHFQYEGSKERFFWNGTTAYWLAGWDDENIAQIIDRLDRLKVTRVRAALCGRVKDGRAWFENVFPTEQFSFRLNPWLEQNPNSIEQPGYDVTRFNVAFWQKYERLLAKLGARTWRSQ